jgi:GNAT superfamily N-acetyltransferase
VKLTFTLENQPASEQKNLILGSLDAFNEAQAGPCNFKEFTLFARSETGSFVGGLVGWTHWNHFFVCALFVEERARRQGIGRELMKRAEELAVEEGCNTIYLDTFDFQAPGFYEKLGFKVFGTLQDYPAGHQRFYLVKQIPDSR